MPDKPHRRLLDTSAIVIGYAMSRLDRGYLSAMKCRTWNQAFDRAAQSLGVPSASIKNLRDEFDPVHGNSRRGWRGRGMYASRQRVMGELCTVSDAALLELVERILRAEPDAIENAVVPLSQPSPRMANVAERLLTGRRAEEYFQQHSKRIVDVRASDLIDCRNNACGFDFGVRGSPAPVFEIKGLKGRDGDVLFTDREWTEANSRRVEYWLVVIANLEHEPRTLVVRDPASSLSVKCQYQTSVVASWRSTVSVQ